MDTRPVTNADSIVHVTATGDLSRFVHPITGEVLSRMRWNSEDFSGSTFEWSVDIDHADWLIQ